MASILPGYEYDIFIIYRYYDNRSGWVTEFVSFNKIAKEDQFGRYIKLANGNVASRILPVKIHDLDQ